MHQYRNLPPRHQPPGFYPPHQPSLRQQSNAHQTASHHTAFNGSHPLTRSHSHGILHSSPPHHVTHSTAGYRTHHIPPPDKHKKEHLNGHSPPYVHNGPDTALYAIQQMQRIKAATACQIINNRVVEAIRLQQQKKMQEKQLKRKLDPNWKDPNETNPNNPAYKGPENAKLLKLLSKKKKKIKKVGGGSVADSSDKTQEASTPEPEVEVEEEETTDNESQQQILTLVDDMQNKLEQAYTERTMTIPQLEISTAPKSTANITNLSEEELKMNPELYKMYSYYIPFANSQTPPHSASSSSNLRSQSLPPQVDTTPPAMHHNHHRSNMGPRRRNPNFLKPQLINEAVANDFRSHSYSPNKHHHQHKAKLVPIGKVKPNPLDVDPPNPVISKSAAKRAKDRTKKHTEPHIAPAHANVQSVISPNGGIYHPCHGYSTRDISIFDLFPGIVKYQSKKYAESDRVDYLLSLSEKSFCSVNNKPLKVDEAEMWYTALKYLFNDITLGQFDYMSVEMRYVIKQYMSTHKNRLSFLNSIKSYGFLRVISDVSKKLPREHIQKIMKQEREKKEKEKLISLQKQLRYQQIYHQQQIYQQQQLYQQHATHYADWYTGNKLKRTISEPTPLTALTNANVNVAGTGSTTAGSIKPCIVESDEEDIDDSWEFITEIVNNHKIPDLPPEIKKDTALQCDTLTAPSTSHKDVQSSSASNANANDKEDTDVKEGTDEMEQVVDVYTMLYQTMKDKNVMNGTVTANEAPIGAAADDNGPDVSLEDIKAIATDITPTADDTFTPKVN